MLYGRDETYVRVNRFLKKPERRRPLQDALVGTTEEVSELRIILPVVLYGCETWSLTLRGERRLRVFENRVLRRIFGPKRAEVTGEWSKLHNVELNYLYNSSNNFSGDKIEKNEIGRSCSTYG